MTNISNILRKLTLTVFLTLCAGNMWGDIAFSGGYIYFADVLNINKGYIQLCARQSSWTGVSTMTNIAHTNLYYVTNPQGSGWGGILGWVVISDATEKSNSNFDNWTSFGWCSNWNEYGFNSGSTYVIVPSSTSKSQSVTTNYYSGGYSALNHSQTVYKYTSSGATTPASYTAQSVNSGTVTISAYKMTGNGTASNSSNSGTINTAGTTSLAKSAAYTGEVTLTASANAGYTFVGWFESTSATTALSTSTTYTYNAPNTTKSVYARFLAEETHNVTVSYKCGGATISENTTESAVGVSTARSITAPTIYGYTFSNWTKGNGVNITSGTTSSATIGITTNSSGTYTLTANYTEDLTSTCTLKGSFDTWGAGVAMTKKTGHSAEYWVYATYSFTGSTTTTQFKILDGSDWYGKNSTNITKTSGSLTKSVTGLSTSGADISLQHLVTGTYEFAYNISTHELRITWPDVNQIQITYGDESTPAGYYDFDGISGSIYSKAFTFSRDHRYSAKIIYHSDFYTFDTEDDMTVDSHTDWRLYNNQNKICNLWAPVAGTYTYQFNSDNSSNTTLTVVYPSFFRLYFDESSVNSAITDSIAVWPVVYPTPGGTNTYCWELLYDNGNAIPGHDAVLSAEVGHHDNQVRFYVGDLAAGTYKVRATLHSGSTCDGTVVNTTVEPFYVVSDYNVTIRYECGGLSIKDQITMSGNPLEWTDITAPDIVGYTFSTWHAGDGITLQSAATERVNKFKADYGGTLTAVYTKRRVIYFNNTYSQWGDVYVYFYKNNSYWDDGNGTGADKTYEYTDHPYSEELHGHMTQIEGTNIWYFDCETAGVNETYTNVVFTELDQHGYGFFHKTGTIANKVIRRSDYNASALPMFVSIDQTGVSKNGGGAFYYNEGYWMNYPENTGYTLKIYDRVSEDGAVEVASIPFEYTADKTLPMALDVLLDAATTYGYKIYRADNVWLGNTGTMRNGASGDVGETPWAFTSGTPKCGLLTTAAGTYTFTLSYGNSSGYNYLVSVHYPAKVGDWRIIYRDLATWSQGTAHNASWYHPSRVIPAEGGKTDTLSFFISKGSTPTLQKQKVNSVNASTGAVTWENVGDAFSVNDVAEIGVYNFKVTQNADGSAITSVENIGAYEGNYYIRGGAFNNKWENFLSDHDHLMTYSEFSESEDNSFGDKYSHYKAKWCPRGTNVKFCIANDYSLCISDTLLYDVPNTYGNINSNGTLKSDGSADVTKDKWSANIRFMWNRKTNKISRAYVSSSTNVTRKFLVLQGCDAKLHDSNNAIMTDNATLLQDDQNWIYEVTVKAQPTARVKLYACYGETTPNVSKAQYFRGAYDGGSCGSEDNSIQILGGSGSTYYTVRVIYDFKTNRLVCAWLPDNSDIDTDLHIQADVMIIRDHQNAAQCITFANDNSKLSEVKTVYGTMRFNRWTLNNRARGLGGEEDNIKEHMNHTDSISKYHPVLTGGEQKSIYERASYFISFPFDVNLGEVFGFGTYGTHWILSEYNGLRRAQDGYFYDNCKNWDCTNWDYILDPTGVTLHAYQGYLLQLDLDLMAYDDTTNFWLNQIHQVELYFPSSMQVSTIASTSALMPALPDSYICTINHNHDGTNPEGDRRVKDSYWRCIGVPSYANYGTILKTGESGSNITWQTNYTWRADFKDYPFLYEWNMTDNSLSAQATSLYTFKTMHAYLVQNGNPIYWQAVNATPSPIVARNRQEDKNEFLWRLTLQQVDDFADQTFIRMTDDEQVTDAFDFNQDMAKEEKVGYSNIYSLISYERVAANSIPLNKSETITIPLGVQARTAGEYTFALPDGAQGAAVTLLDNENGIRTNLAAGLSYTVTLNQGTTENRFLLEVSTKNTPTDIETDNVPKEQNTTNQVVRKVLVNGVLYILRDNKIYNAVGLEVK